MVEKVKKKEEENRWNRFRKGLGNTFGKAVYRLKGLELHKKVAKHGKFITGATAGAGLALAGKGVRKLKEHIWSKNQFDKLICIGLLYYGLQWYYKLVLERDVFSNVPSEFMIINFIIAILVLLLCFKPDLSEFIGTGVLILFYIFIIQTGTTINLPIKIVGEIGTIISLVVITVIIALIWRDVLHKDISGMIGVSSIFLLEIGFKVFLASQVPIPLLIDFLLHLPYWLLLGIIVGGYVEGGASRFVEFVRGAFLIFIISFVAINLLLTGTSYGATKFTISEEKKIEGREAFKEGWKNFVEGVERISAPLVCVGEPTSYQKCVAEKTKPKKEELTEEELLSFSVNREKPKRINMYFIQPDISLDNVIFTQLRGQSIVDGKEILFSCSVNEISGTVKPKSTFTEKDNLNWWEDIECTSPELKLTNEVEFTAQWRQKTGTKYPNYFIDYNEFYNILEKHKTAEYIEMEKKCKDDLCIRNIQKRLYQNIEDFRNNDYPSFETSSIVDDEPIYILLHTDYVPIIAVKEDEVKKIDLIIKIANMENGEIVTVHNIEIDFPEFITAECDINLKEIDWSKIKYGKENQKRIGKCELKINPRDMKFTDISKLNKALIKATTDFEYKLKSKGNVRYYG